MIGPNVNDQSWQWLMGWVRDLDARVVAQLADDYTLPALDTAYLRGRHAVYKELLRLDAEARADDVASLISTDDMHEA